MKTYFLHINTHSGAVRNWDGSALSGIQVVHGDTVLFLCHFQEPDENGNLQDVNLSLATAVRMSAKSARTDDGTSYGTQDSYNQGFHAKENLATGYISWLFPFTDAAIDTALGNAEDIIAAWIEFSGIFQTYAQTLAQLPIDIVQELDAGNPGSPPPTEPTYYTAATVDANFVPLTAHFDQVQIATDTTITAGAAVDGPKRWQTTAVLTLTLPDPAALTGKDRFTVILERLTADTITVDTTAGLIKSFLDPAGSASASFGGAAYTRVTFEHDGTDWIVFTDATP